MATSDRKSPFSWFRRVVPAGYHQGAMIFDGTTPLLMKSGEYDRGGETYRAYTALGAKRGKSMDDKERLRELEWALGLYFDSELGPYIPGKNVKEMLNNAATNWRKGQDVYRSLAVLLYRIPLIYEGPRTQPELWEAGFEKTMMVANNGPAAGRVDRCRPMFAGWGLVAEIAYDPEDIDPDFLPLFAERSQRYGLGDYRPAKGGDFGQFIATWVPGEIHKAAANGDGLKATDKELLRAHVEFCDRIMRESGQTG
jgi:hypothetical protein